MQKVGKNIQQESIPEGCVPPACQPYPMVSLDIHIPTPLWIYPPPGHNHPLSEGTWYQRYSLERTRDQRYPPTPWTNTCENITFPQLRWRAVKTVGPWEGGTLHLDPPRTGFHSCNRFHSDDPSIKNTDTQVKNK